MYRKANRRVKVVECLSETDEYAAMLQYLVETRDAELWTHALSTEKTTIRRARLATEAITEAQNTEYFSQITKAFLDANMINDLIMFLEKSVTDMDSHDDRHK